MLQTQSIIKLTAWIITLPFYIYAFLKWYQFKGHFLIQNRFPQISYTIFCIAFFGQTLSLIEDILFDNNISSKTVHHNISYGVLSLTFAISGLVLYRINLVYVKWKSLHEILKPRISLSKIPTANSNSIADINNVASSSNVLNNPPNTTIPNKSSTEQTKSKSNVSSFNLNKLKEAASSHGIKEIHNNVYSSKLSLIILFFIFIGTLIPYLSNTLSVTNDIAYAIVTTEFAILWMLIAFSIFNIKHNKVTEGIGCIKECYAILISLLIQMSVPIITPEEPYIRNQMLEYTTVFVSHFGGIITLYIPLILILKAEGTLNMKTIRHTTDDKIFQNATCMSNLSMDMNMEQNNENNPEIVLDLNGNINLPTINTQPNAAESDKSNTNTNVKVSKTGPIFVNKCLFHFLYRNQHNHQIFNDYLRFCFASENLLFIERVSIFYQIAFKLQNQYQMSLIKICNDGLAPLPLLDRLSISTLTLDKACDSVTLSATPRTNDSSSFRPSELSLTHTVTHSRISAISHSRVSAVYVDQNGELATAPNDQREKNQTDTPTMTPVTPIPTTFNDWSDIKNMNRRNSIQCVQLKYIYRFEFQYLQEIYAHYQQIIDTNENNDDYAGNNYIIDNYKKALYQIAVEIYEQFISSDALTQVNLGYEVSEPLKYYLANSDKLKKFQNYDDFLRLFDGAVIDTYRLMINVYNFRFSKYVRTRFTDAVFEK